MHWLNWNDFITPSNPYAALFFGVVITGLVSIGIWLETKEWKIVFTVLGVGAATSLIVVLLLNITGFYY
ncbi:hypothetical protein ACLIBH_05165 [Virgibacillus sp. W0430]|uniref:hypothetical protein n=1 Tax=Virgibacillus sp. W0430 TaxID=3391580 RepID=UPI003F4662E8